MANRVLEALLKVKADNKDLKRTENEAEKTAKALKNAKEQTESLTSSLNRFTKIATSTFTTMLTLTDYTDKYVTSQKVLNQTFGEGTDSINNYMNSLANMTGISETSISNIMSLFGQMSTSLGMATEMAQDFSIALTDMSAKLSLLYNIDFQSASKALLDAAKGESSTLTTLTGIVIKNQSLQNTLAELGINKQASELNGANLAMLQYITVARQLNVTNEDMQEIVNGVAFQKQILTNQIKNLYNAFGNLLYPILQKILPILNAILIVITNIINAFARLLGYKGDISSSVGGISGSFDDLSASIDKANASASKSLRSFDKLNNITTPSTSSSSLGAGSIDPTLYEEVQKIQSSMLDISNKAQEIADKIMKWLGFTRDINGELQWQGDVLLDNIFSWWSDLNVLGKVFVSLGLVAVLNNVFNVLRKIVSPLTKIIGLDWKGIKNILSTRTLTTVQKLFGVLAGVTAIVGGIVNLRDALNSIFSGTADIYTYSQALQGLVEIISGVAIIVGALTGNFVALGAGIAGLAVSTLGGYGDKMLQASDVTYQFNERVDSLNKSLQEGLEIAEAEVNMKMSQIYRVQELSRELENYVDQNGKVIESDERVKYILDQLNDSLGTNYQITNGSITLNGELVRGYEELEKQVYDYINSLKAQYIQEAYKDVYIEALKNQQQEQKAIQYANDTYNAQLEEINEKEKEGVISAEEARRLRNASYDEWQQALQVIQGEYAKTNKIIEDYENLSYDLFTGNIEGMQSTVESILDSTVDLAEEDKNIIKDIMKTAQTELQKFESQLKKTQDTLKKTGVSGALMSPSAKAYADGGFVDTGEIFIARERGPELVGTIGAKTAVANNDQIVQGIENGVASGMVKALSVANTGGNQPIYVKAQFGDEEITDWIRVQQTKKNRQFGF